MKIVALSLIVFISISCNSKIEQQNAIIKPSSKISIKKRILFITSNAHFYGDSDIESTNHFPEIIFAYDEFIKQGFEVDFVSPIGGAIPVGYIHGSDATTKKYLYDEKFMNKLEHTYSPDQIHYTNYIAVYYSGGGSAMFTVPENDKIQDITLKIYENNKGIISAICHGTAGLAHIKKSNNTYLVANKKITGFPDLFENKEAAYYHEFPFSIQDKIIENGGDFSFSEKGWDSYYVNDGRIVTGQDPTSAHLVAKKVIEIINNQDIN